MTLAYDEWVAWRMCLRKHPYASRLLADNWATAFRWQSGDRLTSYRCPACSEYHLTKREQ